MRYLYSFILVILFSNCNNTNPLEGMYARDPVISFYKLISHYDSTLNDTVYYARITNNFLNESKLLVRVGEFNRSDGKPCPAAGKDLAFTVKSTHGEEEIFTLDTPQPDWNDSADNITPYFKYVYPETTDIPHKFNGIIEIHNMSDTLTVYYRSYWHDHLVTDSLLYNP